jgi:hypothetical protein
MVNEVSTPDQEVLTIIPENRQANGGQTTQHVVHQNNIETTPTKSQSTTTRLLTLTSSQAKTTGVSNNSLGGIHTVKGLSTRKQDVTTSITGNRRSIGGQTTGDVSRKNIAETPTPRLETLPTSQAKTTDYIDNSRGAFRGGASGRGSRVGCDVVLLILIPAVVANTIMTLFSL